MMSSTVPAHHPAGTIQGNKRILFGIGVSVGVHILLMLAYRSAGLRLPAAEPEAPASILVQIAAPPQAEPPRPAPDVQRGREAAAPRRARQPAPQALIAVPASPRQEASPDPFMVEQADPPAPAPAAGEPPRFDLNAARQTARHLAGQTKLGREDTAHAQFPDAPLETESTIARGIREAKRRDCKDGIPGGLLAPLFLMMDKKDHGCKW